MKLDLTNFSIVVIAQANNPSILNPDFLRINSIVDASFTPTNVICTQPVAQVSYAEGVSIIADFERLQFVDTELKRIPNDSPIPKIATQYIKVLPQVRYTAAGINFTGHIVCKDLESARNIVLEKFIKDGPWLGYGDKGPQIGLKFAYIFDKVKSTIAIDATEMVKSDTDKQPVILVNANYHIDVKGNAIDEIGSFVSNWHVQYDRLNDFIKEIFPGE